METLQLAKKDAIAAYMRADVAGKKLLTDLYPGCKFDQRPMDWVKTWEDICTCKGIDPVYSLPFLNPTDEMQTWLNGAFKAATATEVINEGWKPDYNNSNQKKWHIWWNKESGFRFDGTGWANTAAGVGPRLCFETEAKAKYAGTVLINIYFDFFNK